jgi:hypothetical protein
LQVLKEGPEHHYGSETEEERECCKRAKEIILQANEDPALKNELLEALIDFKIRIERDGTEFNAAGESC